MEKTIHDNLDLNYRCKHCGQSVFNAIKKQINCTNCGKRTTEIHPIRSIEEKKAGQEAK